MSTYEHFLCEHGYIYMHTNDYLGHTRCEIDVSRYNKFVALPTNVYYLMQHHHFQGQSALHVCNLSLGKNRKGQG